MRTRSSDISVLHVIDSLIPGGAERVLVNLVRGLTNTKLSIGVCVTRKETGLIDKDPLDVPIIILGRDKAWDWISITKFARYCVQHKVAVLHAHGRGSTLFCSLIKLLLLSKIKVIMHDHYGDLRIGAPTSVNLQVVMRRLIDLYIAVDPLLHQWAVETIGVPEEKTMTLTNAVDLSQQVTNKAVPRSTFGKINQPLIGVIVANLRPQKNHLLLFHALARSEVARNHLHVLVVGGERDDEYSRMCRQNVLNLNLQDNISFFGSRTDIQNILSAADFGLLCSRSESGPLVLLEYMAAGLPFLCTQTGQIAQTLMLHEHGLYAPPDDLARYSNLLEKLVTMSKTERLMIADTGKSLLYRLFSIESRVQDLLRVYYHLGVREATNE